MDPDVYFHVSSIGAYYSLQTLLKTIPQANPCSFNALILTVNLLSADAIGTPISVAAVSIPEVRDQQDAESGSSTIVCEYVMASWLLNYGDVWDAWMEGHPMLEGRLVRAKVTVT